MSAKATFWAWEQPVEHPPTKLVLLCLADHSGEGGECWPSIGRLSVMTGLSESTIRNCIVKLEASGYLTKTSRIRENGSQSSNNLRLNVGDILCPVGSSGIALQLANHPPGDTPPHPPGDTPPHPPGDTPPEPTIKNLLNEHTPSMDELRPVQTEVIWDEYPKKVAKPAGLRAIRNALKKVPYGTLLKHVQEYAAFCRIRRVELQYIPHPATWFNNERWNDEVSIVNNDKPCAPLTSEQIIANL